MPFRSFACLLLVLLVQVPAAHAGIAQIIHPTTGRPIGWVHPEAIPYSIDPGGLGRLSPHQALALVEAMMAVWEEVEAADMHFEFARMLSEDVTSANIGAYVNGAVCADGLLPGIASMKADESPIIFDDNGSIIDLLVGQGASRKIVGRSGLRCYAGSLADPVGATQAFMVMNGRFFDGKDDPEDLSINAFTGIILHELGHFLGLHHSMVNEALFADLVYERRGEENSRFIPVMYPLVYADHVAGTVLKPDDIAAIAALYPSADFAATRSTLSGTIYDARRTPFRGANVVARRQDDPWCEAIATVSGRFCTPLMDENDAVSLLGQSCPTDGEGRGLYRLEGLPPGEYTIEVEEVTTDGGARQNMFPREEGADLPGAAEYYNVGDRSVEQSVAETILAVPAGTILTDLDILLGSGAGGAPKTLSLPPYVAADETPCVVDPVDYAAFLDVVAGEEETELEPDVAPAAFVDGGGCALVPSAHRRPANAAVFMVIFPLAVWGLARCASRRRAARRRGGAPSRCLRMLRCAGALLGVLVIGQPAWATSMLPMRQRDLADEAETIFRGQCLDLQVSIDERGLLVTDVTFVVHRLIKGAAGRTITFRVLGNAAGGDAGGDAVAEGPRFAVGDEGLLMLYPASAWGLTSIVGGGQGYFPITTREP